jgi:hypothetical protein
MASPAIRIRKQSEHDFKPRCRYIPEYREIGRARKAGKAPAKDGPIRVRRGRAEHDRYYYLGAGHDGNPSDPARGDLHRSHDATSVDGLIPQQTLGGVSGILRAT